MEVKIGPYREGGVENPPEDMVSLGGSRYGTRFLIAEPLFDARMRNFRVRRWFRNWRPEAIAPRIWLICLSLQNVIASLRIFNGDDAEQVRFEWPEDKSAFDDVWAMPSMAEITFDSEFSVDGLDPVAPDGILDWYRSTRT